jgi:hypothetical protein
MPHITTQYKFAAKLYRQDWPEIASHRPSRFKDVPWKDPQTPAAARMDANLRSAHCQAPKPNFWIRAKRVRGPFSAQIPGSAPDCQSESASGTSAGDLSAGMSYMAKRYDAPKRS